MNTPVLAAKKKCPFVSRFLWPRDGVVAAKLYFQALEIGVLAFGSPMKMASSKTIMTTGLLVAAFGCGGEAQPLSLSEGMLLNDGANEVDSSIVIFKEMTSRADIQTVIDSVQAEEDSALQADFKVIPGFRAKLSASALDEIRRNPDVAYVEQNSLVRLNDSLEQYIVVFEAVADRWSIEATAHRVQTFHTYRVIPGFAATLHAKQLNELRRDPNVAYVQQDSFVHLD